MVETSHTLRVIDQDSKTEAVVILRALEGGQIAIAVSLKENGDAEVVLARDDAVQVFTRLRSMLGSDV
jgi:hypothetical protein